MTGITQFGYIEFEVSDPSAWAEFTTKALGLELSRELPGGGFSAPRPVASGHGRTARPRPHRRRSQAIKLRPHRRNLVSKPETAGILATHTFN